MDAGEHEPVTSPTPSSAGAISSGFDRSNASSVVLPPSSAATVRPRVGSRPVITTSRPAWA